MARTPFRSPRIQPVPLQSRHASLSRRVFGVSGSRLTWLSVAAISGARVEMCSIGFSFLYVFPVKSQDGCVMTFVACELLREPLGIEVQGVDVFEVLTVEPLLQFRELV